MFSGTKQSSVAYKHSHQGSSMESDCCSMRIKVMHHQRQFDCYDYDDYDGCDDYLLITIFIIFIIYLFIVMICPCRQGL